MSMYRSIHDSTNMWTLESPFEFQFAEKKRKDSSCNVLTAVWITHSTDSNGYDFRTEFSSIPMNITYIDAIGIHLYFVRLYPWEYIRRWLTSIVSTHSFSLFRRNVFRMYIHRTLWFFELISICKDNISYSYHSRIFKDIVCHHHSFML